MGKIENIQNKLVPIAYLLHDDIHSFVENKSVSIVDKDKRVIEQKLLFIVEALSLLFYGTPIFDVKFHAKEKGPVEWLMKSYQNNDKLKIEEIKKVENKIKDIDDEDIAFAKYTSKKLFKLLKEAIEKNLIKYDVSYLSELTHTADWQKKFDENNKYHKCLSKKEKNKNAMTEEEIYNFANEKLKKELPDFIRFIKEGL